MRICIYLANAGILQQHPQVPLSVSSPFICVKSPYLCQVPLSVSWSRSCLTFSNSSTYQCHGAIGRSFHLVIDDLYCRVIYAVRIIISLTTFHCSRYYTSPTAYILGLLLFKILPDTCKESRRNSVRCGTFLLFMTHIHSFIHSKTQVGHRNGLLQFCTL